jgi:two-component system response regulator PilR (NtrC family)
MEHDVVKKVLIVDDDEDIRSLLCQVLKKNFQVFEAAGGNEAWQMLQNQNFDAVITDMRMPEGTGDELLKKIRQKYNNKIPVIIITAFSDQPSEYLINSGANAVFPKPFDYEQIITSLNNFMR